MAAVGRLRSVAVAILLAALGAITVFAVPAPARAQEFAQGGRATFDRPTVNGVALDWCVSWGAECGQPMADLFCRNQGFLRSIGYLTYTPGQTWVTGNNATCDGPLCGGMLRIDCERGGGAPAQPVNVATMIPNSQWQWFDNGNHLGTATFHANGVATSTWDSRPGQWWVDTNGDLMVSGGGYVARLVYDPASDRFSGGRDVTSIQDGVTTVLQR